MSWFGLFVIGLHIFEMIMQNLEGRFCTSKKLVLIRILITATNLFYVVTGHWISGRIIRMVEIQSGLIKPEGERVFQHNKFSGMDMEFLVNQIYFVKLVILILILSLISSISEKMMNFIGVIEGRTQNCKLYQSLIKGANTNFFQNNEGHKQYSDALFSNFQFLTIYLHRVFEIFLPLIITLFVYFHIERSDYIKHHFHNSDIRNPYKKIKS